MIKRIESETFEILLCQTEKERGVSQYKIFSDCTDNPIVFDSLIFNAIDELIELLQTVKKLEMR